MHLLKCAKDVCNTAPHLEHFGVGGDEYCLIGVCERGHFQVFRRVSHFSFVLCLLHLGVDTEICAKYCHH